MAGPAAAAEELPVLVGLYLTVSAIVVWLLLRALKIAWVNTLGALLLALGHLLQYHKGPINISWGDYFFDLDTKIEVWIRDEIAAQEYAIGWFWHQTARVQGWLAHETWAMARDAFHFGGWLVHTYVPTYVEGVTHLYHSATRTVVKQVTVIQSKTATIARTVALPYAGELAWIHRHWKALTRAVAIAGTITIPGALAWERVWHGIDDLRKWRVITNKRLHRIEAAFGAVAFAGLMANAMGISWRCLRPKGPIGRAAKTLCGLPGHWLEDVLGLLADFVILENICAILPWIEDGVSLVATPLVEALTVAGAGLCSPDAKAPPTLAVPQLYLPPVAFSQLYLP